MHYTANNNMGNYCRVQLGNYSLQATHTHTDRHTHTHTHAHTHTYRRTHTCTHVHTHAHAHTHTHIHVCIMPASFPYLTAQQLVCRNSTPYELKTSDALQVTIKHTATSTVVPHAVEPAPPTNHSKLRLSFTTRLAGEYSMNVQINGKKISGSPFTRTYSPGTMYMYLQVGCEKLAEGNLLTL